VSEQSASEAVRYEWRNRIHAEYTSAAITQHLTLWLIQMGASPDLIDDGLRIVTDELVHAQMSAEVYAEAGGTEPPQIERESLQLPRHPEQLLEMDITRAGVQMFCLGETVAVPLFSHLRQGCTVPVARDALDRILKDEVRHRDFGWQLLDALLDTPVADELRQLIDVELPQMMASLQQSYGDAVDDGAEAIEDISDADRLWGLAPASEYAEILSRTIERDYIPRFNERSIDLVRLLGRG